MSERQKKLAWLEQKRRVVVSQKQQIGVKCAIKQQSAGFDGVNQGAESIPVEITGYKDEIIRRLYRSPSGQVCVDQPNRVAQTRRLYCLGQML